MNNDSENFGIPRTFLAFPESRNLGRLSSWWLPGLLEIRKFLKAPYGPYMYRAL